MPHIRMNRRRGCATTTVASLAMVLLASCSGGNDPNPYEAQFAQAMAETDNEFVRGVLSDGKTTASEVQEAGQRALDCMSAAGLPADFSFHTDEYGQVALTSAGNLTSLQMAAEADCELEWSNDIIALYNDMIRNPNNDDLDGLVASCLVRKGLAPEGFTGQDYKHLIESNSMHLEVSTTDPQADGEIIALPDNPDAVEMLLPGGQPLDEGEALRCQRAPLQ